MAPIPCRITSLTSATRTVTETPATARTLASWLLALLILVPVAGAQKLRVEAFSFGDGLPGTSVFDLEQDSSGRLWILGRTGITVYDGRSFQPPPDAGLPADFIQDIELGPEGRMWALQRSLPRLFVLQGSRWRSLPPPPREPAGASGWATCLAAARLAGRATIFVGTTQEGLAAWDGEAWLRYGIENGLPSPYVTDLSVLGETVAVGTSEGLCRLRRGRLDCRLQQIDPRLAGRIFALHSSPFPDGEHRLWILGPDWMGHLEDDRLIVLADFAELGSYDPAILGALAVDPAGGVYFGSAGTLFYLDPLEG